MAASGTRKAVGIKEVAVELRRDGSGERAVSRTPERGTSEYFISVSRRKVAVGDCFVHEKHGLGKLAQIKENGDFVMAFDSGDSHTYQPKSIYKLRPISAEAAKTLKAGGGAGSKKAAAGGGVLKDLHERMELYKTLMSGARVTVANWSEAGALHGLPHAVRAHGS